MKIKKIGHNADDDSTAIFPPMKTPPFLLGAILAFWGWQSDLLWLGTVMGIALESARFVKIRWEFSETDFRRIATFCTLLSVALAIYAFSENNEGGTLLEVFRGPGAARNAAVTTVHTATAWLRWLPIALFFFVAAQVFSVRDSVPLTFFSMYWRRRVRREQKRGNLSPAIPTLNITYPYFILCLFSSSIHSNNGGVSFFWGQALLLGWALQPFRSRRFGITIWLLALTAALALSFFGQAGIGQLQQFVDRYDAQLLFRLLRVRTDPAKANTAIGQIGEMKLSGQIIIRLKTAGQSPPSYLREATYRNYQPRTCTWFSGSHRNEYETIYSPLTNQTTWILLSGKTNNQSVNIACYLNGRNSEGNPEGLLPLPDGTGRLEKFNAYIVQKNPLGDVLVQGPGLAVFDALYGPGQTMDSPPETNWDYYVPTNEAPALNSVVSEMNLQTRDERKILLGVDAFFQNKFSYSVWRGRESLASSNETALAKFLLHTRKGHCEYFATATVLLLRQLGIPTRYAIGYYVHENSGHGYVVRERDAHAWCLVWNHQAKCWDNFDTTPGSWLRIEGDRASHLQPFWDFFSWIQFQISKFRWGQNNVRQYILWGLIPLLMILLWQIIFRRGRGRQKSSVKKNAAAVFWPGLDSEFYALEKKLAQRGATRAVSEPLSDWLARALENPALSDLRAPLTELLELHYRYRFDPRGLNNAERERLTRQAKTTLDAFAQMENTAAKV